jgi:ribosomal protein S25
MSDKVIINATLEENKLENLKKSLEKKSMVQVQDLYKGKGVNSSSAGEVLTALNNGNITEKNLKDIMQQGFDTFKQETGRSMSYGEMREMYG